jgi:hypothetical protein
MSYFNNFPNIEYRDNQAKNIIARPRILLDVFTQASAFYDYVIDTDMRADQVAFHYYDDPSMVWLIYLANDIVDPYHDWPLTQDQLNKLLEHKYGVTNTSVNTPTNGLPAGGYKSGIELAKTTVIHYRHNTDGRILSKSTFDLNGTFNTVTNPSDYTAVTAYLYEHELNESKRKIKLIDKQYADQIKDQLRDVMSG